MAKKATNKNKKTKVLFASPEVMPFGGTGGLGEVAGSMPREVNRMKGSDVECRVIMPLYDSVKDEYRKQMTFLGSQGSRSPGAVSTWASSN